MPAHLPELSSTPSPLPSWPSRCAGLLLFPHCLSPFPSHLPPLFALRAPRHHSALKSKVMSAERPPGSRASPSPLHRPPSIPRDAAQANIYSVIVSPLCLDWKFHESRDLSVHCCPRGIGQGLAQIRCSENTSPSFSLLGAY